MSNDELIDNIFLALKQLGMQSAERKNPGLEKESIRSFFHEVGLVCPQGVEDIYSYCNGTCTSSADVLGMIDFFPGFYWMDIAESVSVYGSIAGQSGWDDKWLPLFANGGGDFYAVICDEGSADIGGLVGFVLGERDHIVEFRSLPDMLKVIYACYQQNVFSLRDGGLEANYADMRLIARRVQYDFIEHSYSSV